MRVLVGKFRSQILALSMITTAMLALNCSRERDATTDKPLPAARESEAAASTETKTHTAGYVQVNKSGVAIGGYDPVAYFTDGKPVSGNSQFATQWEGATWYFASAEHRDMFTKEPTKYAPQYGGWCALGASRGYAAEVDPVNAWTVHDGKLYLNWDTKLAAEWSQDIPGYLKKSDANWSTIKSGLGDGTTKIYRKGESP